MSKKEKESLEQDGNFMIKVATFIVDRRNLFFLLFGILIIFSVVAMGWVKVENSLSAYLPDTTGSGLNGRAVYYLRLCQGNGSEHHI